MQQYLQRESRVLVIGDSHVRRLQREAFGVRERLAGIETNFMGAGGSGSEFVLSNAWRADGYRVVIVMTGGNDLANGHSLPHIIRQYQLIADSLLSRRGVEAVIFPSIWPRRDNRFNGGATQLADCIQHLFRNNSRVALWRWDRRQPFRTYDGVHLTQNGYRRAMRYLVPIILWAVYNLQTSLTAN